MKRTEIAVRGAPSTEALRLELSGRPGEDKLALEFLHDDRQTGTLARVLGGWVGLAQQPDPAGWRSRPSGPSGLRHHDFDALTLHLSI